MKCVVGYNFKYGRFVIFRGQSNEAQRLRIPSDATAGKKSQNSGADK